MHTFVSGCLVCFALATVSCADSSADDATPDDAGTTDVADTHGPDTDGADTDGADTDASDAHVGDTAHPDADAGHGCEHGELAPSICRPSPPRGTADDACPSGEFAAAEYFEGEGVCVPDRPRGTPAAECPNGTRRAIAPFSDGGICEPRMPELSNWDCAENWSVERAFVDLEGEPAAASGAPTLVWCIPGPRPTDCAPDERPDADGGCVPVGGACPEDGRPDADRLRGVAAGFDGAILHVRADADPGGDGSADTPFSSLPDALAAAADGDIVAVLGEVEVGDVDVDVRVAVVGLCVEDSALIAADAPMSLTADGVRLIDVAVRGGSTTAIRVRGRDALLSGVSFDSGAPALHIDGGTAEVRDAALRRSETAIALAAGGTLELQSVVVDGFSHAGVSATDGGTLDATDLLVRQGDEVVVPSTVGVVIDGSTARLERTVVDGGAVGVRGENGAELAFTDVAILGRPQAAAGEFAAGTELRSASALEARRVVWSGLFGHSLVVDGAQASIVQGATRDSRPTSDELRVTPMEAIRATNGSELTLSEVIVSRGSGGGLVVDRAATLRADDIVVFRTQFIGRQHTDQIVTGRGLVVYDGADAVVSRAWVEGGGDAMVLIDAATATLADIVAHGGGWTAEELGETQLFGDVHAAGLACRNGCVATAHRVFVGDTLGDGLESSNASDLRIFDAILDGRDALGESVGSVGINNALGRVVFTIGTPGTLAAERVFVGGYRLGAESSAVSGDAVGEMTLRDVVVDGEALGPESPGDPDPADPPRHTPVGARTTAVLSASRSAFRNLEQGLQVTNRGRLFAEDVTIDHVGVQEEGRGVSLTDGLASLDRVRISDCSRHGVVVSTRSSLTAEDMLVSGNEGRGLSVQRDSIANATRLWLSANDGVGVYVADNGRATLADVVVSRTQQRECAATTCADAGEGFGVGVFDASSLDMTRFTLDANAVIGLAVDEEGSVTARDGVISNHLIGVNVTAPNFDPTTAFDNVRAIANQVDLSAREIPVPELLADD